MEQGGGGDKVDLEVVDDIAQLSEAFPGESRKQWEINSVLVFNIITSEHRLTQLANLHKRLDGGAASATARFPKSQKTIGSAPLVLAGSSPPVTVDSNGGGAGLLFCWPSSSDL